MLCVDEKKEILSSVKRLLRKEGYHLHTASSAQEGFEIFKTQKIHLVISDHRMSGMSGTDFLSKIKEMYPDTIRILLTGYTQIDSIKDSVNKGHIYKFFLKPWNDEHLKIEIRKALEKYDLVQANRALTAAIEKKNQELEAANQNLEVLIQQRTRELELKNRSLELTRNIFENLPFPVLGVGSDQIIILINGEARKMVIDGRPCAVGKTLNDIFPRDFIETLLPVFKHQKDHLVFPGNIGGRDCSVHFFPLGGQFYRKGYLLSFQAQEA